MTDNHAPLCRTPVERCNCPFIARVRADERERIAQAIEAIPTQPGLRQDGMWAMVRMVDAARIARDGGNDD